MTNFFKKHKLLILSLSLIFLLTACRRITDNNSQVLEQYILRLDTPFSVAWKDGLFTALFVYPISLIVNFLATIDFIGAGGSIIITTVVFNALLTKSQIKQQMLTQKQSIIQPELARINAKYEGKTDQQSTIRKNQEVHAIYTKHGINPFASILPLFIQMPFMFAMYGAIQRSYNIINGDFFGVRLSELASNAINFPNAWAYLLIFGLMVVTNFAAFKIPQYLTNKKKKEEGIKDKKYAQDKNAPNPEATLNTTMMFMLLLTSALSWIWPIGMSLYWAVGSICRIAQSYYIYKYHSMKN